MLVGVFAGIVTGALWGLTFVAALAVEPFTPLDLNVGRYGCFGLLSLVLMLHPTFRPRGLSLPTLAAGLGLGLTAYPIYFLTVAYSVIYAGPAIPPLVVGMTPVLMAILGNYGRARVPWRRLALPLGLIAIGVLTVNASALSGDASAARGDLLLGVALAVAALVSWVLFGWANAAVMQRPGAPTPLRWTCVQGVGALIGSVALLPWTDFTTWHAIQALPATGEGRHFIGWAVLMGIGGSWFAAWAWIVASQRLPLAFTAQLVVFETIFGLLDGFIFQQRWPVAAEWIGSCLQLAGVVAAVALFSSPGMRARMPARPAHSCPQS